MSLVMFEGFETHTALTDLQAYSGCVLDNTQALLTAADGNGIGPRAGGSGGCWKGTSTGTIAWNSQNSVDDHAYNNTWPKILLRPPTYQPAPTGTTCTFGFAFYPQLTGAQAWSDNTLVNAAFTPLVAICNNSATPSPHLFLGIDSSLNLHVYRFNQTNYPGVAWNAGPIAETRCLKYDPLNYYQHPLGLSPTAWTTAALNPVGFAQYSNNNAVRMACGLGNVGGYQGNGNSTGTQLKAIAPLIASATINYSEQYGPSSFTGGSATLPAKFTLLGTTSLALAAAVWNYIEVKVVVRNDATGSVQVKINRAQSDATLDLNLSNIQTTSHSNNVVGAIALGQFMGFVSNMTMQRSSGMGSIGMVTYYDDFYWCDENGATFNDFLGPVSITSAQISSVPSNTFATRVGANDVAAIGGKISTASLSEYLESNAKNQTVTFRVPEPSGTILAAQLHATGTETLGPAAQFHMSANYNAGTTTRQNESITNTTRGFNLLLPTAPDGTSWTPAKVAATDFTLEHK